MQIRVCRPTSCVSIATINVNTKVLRCYEIVKEPTGLEAGALRVYRQLQRMRKGGGLAFSEPRNASRRTIDLPQRAIEALRSHRKRQAEEQQT